MHNRSICRAPAIRSVDRHRAQSRRSGLFWACATTMWRSAPRRSQANWTTN